MVHADPPGGRSPAELGYAVRLSNSWYKSAFAALRPGDVVVVFASTAVDEPYWNASIAIFGHAFEGRDADPSGDEIDFQHCLPGHSRCIHSRAREVRVRTYYHT